MRFSILSILLFLSLNGFSQFFEDNQQERASNRRFFWGGGLGFVGGTVTHVEVSPLVGYWITPKWNAGLTFNYEYYKDTRFSPTLETNIYGSGVFSEYYIINNLEEWINGFFFDIFLHAEYEALNLQKKYFQVYNFSNLDGRFWYHSVLLGGGINQKIGPNASINLMILWNVNETENTPYSNPIIRLGFAF